MVQSRWQTGSSIRNLKPLYHIELPQLFRRKIAKVGTRRALHKEERACHLRNPSTRRLVTQLPWHEHLHLGRHQHALLHPPPPQPPLLDYCHSSCLERQFPPLPLPPQLFLLHHYRNSEWICLNRCRVLSSVSSCLPYR